MESLGIRWGFQGPDGVPEIEILCNPKNDEAFLVRDFCLQGVYCTLFFPTLRKTYIAIYSIFIYTIEFNILNVFFCRRGLAIETPRLSKRLDLAVLGLCRVPIQYLA